MKTYYTIDPTIIGSPLLWIDERGEHHEIASGDQAQFKKDHPRSVFLRLDLFYKRLGKLADDKNRLEVWNQRLPIR